MADAPTTAPFRRAGELPISGAMTAIVFVSGLAADNRVRVGGLSLLDRALIVAGRAGVKRCLVVGAKGQPRPDRRFPRVTPVVDLDDARAVLRAEGATGDTRVLCLHAGVVTNPASLSALVGTAVAAAVVAPPSLPVAVVAFSSLPSIWETFLDAGGGLGGLKIPEGSVLTDVVPRFFVWVERAQDAAAVERRLLLSLENPRDGRVDTVLNRRISRPLTRLLLALPLTPNHVTLFSFVSALLAAMAFARGTYEAGIVGAALFQFAAVLDCCDGEVARVKFQESALGDVLDITLDAVGNIAVFLGIARGAFLAGALPDAERIAWTLGAGIAVIFPLVTWVERSVPTPAPSPEHRMAQSLVATLSTRDFSVLVVLAALTATLPWFLRAAAVGAHVFWVALVILLLRGRR